MPVCSLPLQHNHCITSSQINLVLVKGFVHEVLPQSHMSGSVLQAYLEAIHTKVPELVEKEEIGEGVQGEVGLSNKIIQGDLKADE